MRPGVVSPTYTRCLLMTREEPTEGLLRDHSRRYNNIISSMWFECHLGAIGIKRGPHTEHKGVIVWLWEHVTSPGAAQTMCAQNAPRWKCRLLQSPPSCKNAGTFHGAAFIVYTLGQCVEIEENNQKRNRLLLKNRPRL